MALSPYATVAPYLDTTLKAGWLKDDDQLRAASYEWYERAYWNVQDTFKLTARGSEEDPLYLPNPRVVIEATNRFLAKGWNYVVDPTFGTPADQEIVSLMLRRLFRRETMYAKFTTQKRMGLIKGDAVWHVRADDTKPEGTRISVDDIDPANYFPKTDPTNPEKIVGAYLVDVITYNKTLVNRVQKYLKTETGTISSETNLYELGKWDDRGAGSDPAFDPASVKQVAVVIPVFELPPIITQVPVYHIRNLRNTGSPFGSSELRGFERIAAGVNQTISDNEIALALQGLGLYVTTSGPPTDADGNETNWRLGPGRVVEIDPESEFKRINGITTVQPVIDHITFVAGSGMQALAVPQVAAGNVDVTVAESGISLYLQLSPLLAKNEEKETEMLGVYDQMLYDVVQMWFPAYEAIPAGIAVEVVSTVDDPMPVNKQAEIDNIIKLATSVPPIISAAYARVKLREFGYEFPEEMGVDIVQEQTALAAAQFGDPLATRVDQELA